MKHLAARILLGTTTVSASLTGHAQWQPVGAVGNTYAIVAHQGALFAGNLGGPIRRSTDHGDTWTDVNTGITEASNWWLSSAQGALFCGTQFGPAFRSTDDGASWQDIGLSGARGFAVHNDTLYACQWYGGQVDHSADGGLTWQDTEPISGSGGFWPLISAGGHLFAGGQSGGVHRISHSAEPWTASNNGLTSTEVYAFERMGDVLFAGTGNGGGVFRSDDLGATWTASGMSGSITYALHAVGGLLFAGTSGGGVHLSTDSGATWTPYTNGLTNLQVVRLTSDGVYLYAGTLGGGVFRDGLTLGQAEVEPTNAAEVTVFPVPAGDRAHVRWDGHSIVRYELCTTVGALAQRGSPAAGDIPLDAVAPGAYVLKVEDANGHRRTVRLVRE
ncbi:MAG: exo-alpha-sialidase [Flavobacteriales bacterium]|nr:exo-alpha-sialidase [Flavobacteriales bacterium]